MRRVLGAALLLMAMAALPGRVLAETEVYTFVADYNWREYDGSALAGKERGPIYGVGIAGTYRAPAPNRLSLKIKAEGFGANHDFDIYDSNGNLSGSGDFAGFTLEGDAGMPLRFVNGSSIEPFFGLGYRYWGRSFPMRIHTDNFTQHDTWWNFYGKTGLRLTHRLPGPPMVVFAEGGARIPFSSRAELDLGNYGEATVTPGNRVSGFAEAGVKLNILKVSLFYEGLRFAASEVREIPVSSTASIAVRQPHTNADIFGLRIGVSF